MKPRGFAARVWVGLGRQAGWVAFVGFAALSSASAQPVSASSGAATRPPSLVILSTLPESYARAKVRAFERANPGARVELIHQRPEQVLPTLRSTTPAQRPHVIWSASSESFLPSAAEGLLLGADGEPQPYGAPAPIDRGLTVRAQHLMRVALSRPAGASTPAWPERWQDLAQPGDCGVRLANPFVAPGGVGSLLVEAALQDRGWEAGWTLLSSLAANSTTAASGAPQLALVFEDAAADAGLETRSALTVIVRSRLALVAAGSRDMRLALRFQRFLLADSTASSASGDAVTGAVRASPPSVLQYLTLDLALLERREPVLGAMARQWLVVHAPNLKASCAALEQAQRRAERSGDSVLRQTLDEARARAFGPALSERVLGDDAVVQAFNGQLREALRKPRVAALESQWAAVALERHAQAMNLMSTTGRSGAAGPAAAPASTR